MEQYFRTRASVDDEPDLARDRRANDARLKSRFEHIFTKYGKDFEDIGDEIDLDTGEIVVNNGHLESMRHEVDPGKGAASQVLQVLEGSTHNKRKRTTPGSGLDEMTSMEDSDGNEGASVAGASGYSSSNSNIDEDDSRRHSAEARTPDRPSSESDEAEDDTRSRLEQQNMALREEKTGTSNDEPNIDRTSHPTSRSRSPVSALMNLPSLQESMQALLSNPSHPGSIDAEAIHALGQSIASQLARFMSDPSKKRKSESSSRCTTNDSRWEYPVLPGDRTARTPSPHVPASSSAALFAKSPNDEASIWAVERPRRRKRQRTSPRPTEAVDPAVGDDERDDEPLPDPHAHTPRRTSSNKGSGTTNGRICSHCGDTNSRQWRIGPDGYLCNACGTYYFLYKRPRPFGVPRSASKADTNQTSPAVLQVQQPTAGSVDEYDIPLTSTPGTNGYAANTARRMTPDARYARFTVEEEDAIIKLRAIDQLDWKRIGQLVSNRTGSSVQCHYRKLRKRPDFEDRLRLLAQGTTKDIPFTEHVSKDMPAPNQVEGASLSNTTSMESAKRQMSSLRESPLQTAHFGTVNGPNRVNGNYGPGSRPRFTSSERQLLIRLREGDMEWEQIGSYLPGRTMNSLKAMHRRLMLAQGSPMSDDEAFDEPVQPNEPPSATERNPVDIMPPPPRPASRRRTIDATPVPVVSAHELRQRIESVADQYNSPLPQTPSFPIPPLSHPPRPLEVGPSAWTATQPTSKGPLPFKPARRSLIPIVPKGPPYIIADPFVPDRNSVGDKQTSNSEDATSKTPRQPQRDAKDKARAVLKDLYAATGADEFSASMSYSSHSRNDFVASAVPAAEDGSVPPSPAVKVQAHMSSTTPESRYRVHYSEEETELVGRLKQQGLSWSEMADQMPGRTPASIQNHYYYCFSGTAKQSKPQSGHVTAKRTPFLPPLLRQALDNSTRRFSTGPAAVAHPIDTAHMLPHENDNRPTDTNTDEPPRPTESQDTEATTMQDDEPRTSLAADVASDASSEHGIPLPFDVEASFQAFQDKMAREEDGIYSDDTSSSSSDDSQPDHRSKGFRRNGSSPYVYVVRDGNLHRPPPLDRASVYSNPATNQVPESGADVAPIELGNSHNHSHGRGTSPPPADRSTVGEARGQPPVDGAKNRDEEAGTSLALDNDELPDSTTDKAKRSPRTKTPTQNGTTRKRSSGRSKRVSDFEVADSDSDAAHASQEKADNHGSDEKRATETQVTPAKRGPGRPRRTIPITDVSYRRKGAKVSKPRLGSGRARKFLVSADVFRNRIAREPDPGVGSATKKIPPGAKVINISSDPSIKPEAASESNTATTTRLTKRSGKFQQPTPRSNAHRHSDSTLLVQRPSTMATPAGKSSLASRSDTSSISKRLKSLSRTGPRESPATRDGSGTRRFILATAAGDDGGNEEFDELS